MGIHVDAFGSSRESNLRISIDFNQVSMGAHITYGFVGAFSTFGLEGDGKVMRRPPLGRCQITLRAPRFAQIFSAVMKVELGLKRRGTPRENGRNWAKCGGEKLGCNTLLVTW